MEKIVDKIKDFKVANSITHNPFLKEIDLYFIEKLELEKEKNNNNFCKNKLKQIENNLKNIKLEDFDKWSSIYNIYNELRTFYNLNSNFYIEIIEESSKSSPDFKIVFNDEVFKLEMKSLFYFDGINNFNDTMENGLNARIDVENQLKTKNIGQSCFEIKPYGIYEGINFKSTHFVIKNLIQKIENNIKIGQFKEEKTILLIDMLMLPIFSYPKEALMPVYKNSHYIASGEFWNIAFGKEGDQLYKIPEFEGKSNIDEKLDLDGILTQHDEIYGIIFRTYEGNKKSKMNGLFRRKDINSSFKFIELLCDNYNDEFNSQSWFLQNIE